MPIYVYLHVDPLDKSEKYVGITINLKMRLYQHMHTTCINPGKTAWLQGLRVQGLEPEVRVLDECLTFEKARDREKYWIRYYIDHGVCLLNVADNPLVSPTVNSSIGGWKRYFSPDLRSLRKSKGLTQRALADAVGVQAQTIANYECSRCSPRWDTMHKLSEVLDVPVDILFLPCEEEEEVS